MNLIDRRKRIYFVCSVYTMFSQIRMKTFEEYTTQHDDVKFICLLVELQIACARCFLILKWPQIKRNEVDLSRLTDFFRLG